MILGFVGVGAKDVVQRVVRVRGLGVDLGQWLRCGGRRRRNYVGSHGGMIVCYHFGGCVEVVRKYLEAWGTDSGCKFSTEPIM